MSKLKKTLVIILPFLFLSGIAEATTISFNPVSPSAIVGNSFDVDLVISGLGIGAAPSISTFDLDIGFDENQLSFASAVFGDSFLGNQLDLFDFGFNSTFAGLSAPGTVNIFELSFDLASDLNSLQADSFTLATLTFNVLSANTKTLDIFINALGDADGNLLTANTQSANIISTVPIPAAVWMMGTGLLGLVGVSRRRAQVAV